MTTSIGGPSVNPFDYSLLNGLRSCPGPVSDVRAWALGGPSSNLQTWA